MNGDYQFTITLKKCDTFKIIIMIVFSKKSTSNLKNDQFDVQGAKARGHKSPEATKDILNKAA